MIDKNLIIFIKNILQSTIGVDVNYLTPPYNNITKVDHFLRKNLWPNTDYYSILISNFTNLDDNAIFSFVDSFSTHFGILKIPNSNPDYLCIGPYLLEDKNEEFYQYILKTNGLTNEMYIPIKDYYSELPTVSSSIVVSIYNAIGSFIFDSKSDFKIIYKEETWKNQDIAIDYTPNPEISYAMNLLEERYNNENLLMKAISRGDRSSGLDNLSKLINMKLIPRSKDPIRNRKNQAIILNTLCRKAAEQSSIHPVYLDEISTKFAIEIEKLSSINSIDDLVYEMIKKYCLLVQNHSLKDYSTLIQNTLNYINLNMSKPISLKSIATQFSVNPNYLSTLFKKEVKMTLTEYINKQRVSIAVKMLNTKDMQIQDIAWYVGINDVNYFTKLFKKIIGYTPTEYKKQIWTEDTNHDL